MATTFYDAQRVIDSIAAERSFPFAQCEEIVPLEHAVGRTVSHEIRSPANTPRFSSSAMDGYAVFSRHTQHASEENPVSLRVLGTMAAGDAPLIVDDEVVDGFVPCVEIMTGAAFPIGRFSHGSFDACIPWERTQRREKSCGRGQSIKIDRPAQLNWNKRLSGNDFRSGDLIVAKGTTIEPKHIMALSSVGIDAVAVVRKLRAAILSTGSELLVTGSQSKAKLYQVPDANGPYLVASLHEMGVLVTHVGSCSDDEDLLTQHLDKLVREDAYDLIISTGGVSAGKYDHIPDCVANLRGSVHFHHVAMRPGHPALFAALQNQQNVDKAPALFGLPGNPVAAAACFHFLVAPYVRRLRGQPEARGIRAKVVLDPGTTKSYAPNANGAMKWVVEGSPQSDTFRLGHTWCVADGAYVQINSERSPAKLSPFAASNCWVHIPRGCPGIRAGDSVMVYAFSN